MKTFKEFLDEICFEINPTVLDDDMPDFFDNWLGNLTDEDWLKWGDLYGKGRYLAGKTEIL